MPTNTLATNRTDDLNRQYSAIGDFPYRGLYFHHENDFKFNTDVSRLTWLKTAGQTSPTTVTVAPGGIVTVTIASEADGEQAFLEPAISYIHKAGMRLKLHFDSKISSATVGTYILGLHDVVGAVFQAAPGNAIIIRKAAGAATAVLQVWKAGVKTQEWTTDIAWGTNPGVLSMEVYSASATSMFIKVWNNGFPVTLTKSGVSGESAEVTGTDMPTATMVAAGAYYSNSAAATWIMGSVSGELTRAYSGGISGYGDSSGSDGGAGGSTGSGGPGLGSGLA